MSKILSPKLTQRILETLTRMANTNGLGYTRDQQIAAALSDTGWIVELSEAHLDDPYIVWSIKSPARALGDARALLMIGDEL